MSAQKTYKYPKPDTSRRGRFRDGLAWRIATFALNWIATPWYRAMVGGAINLGLNAARDEAYAERAISFEELIAPTTEEDNRG